MKFNILTLFPEFFQSPLKTSLIGKAIELELIEVVTTNIRDFADSDGSQVEGKRLQVDDSPYGGGAGMVLKVDPVVRAIESLGAVSKAGGSDGVSKREVKVILLTPQGRVFNQGLAKELSSSDELVLICGRYEGFDERIREFVDLEISLGDFVMTGGEVAALAVVDAVARLKEGVVGNSESLGSESFSSDEDQAGADGGLLEYPQYTRPDDFRGLKVPDVLKSGNHKEIKKWRRSESIKRTAVRRPDIIDRIKDSLSDDDIKILKENKNNN